MIGSRQIEHREEALKILDQRLDAVGLSDFFAETKAALVITEDAGASRQIGDDSVPTVEGATDLVQEDHRRPAFALDFVMHADPVGLNERQWLSPSVSQDLSVLHCPRHSGNGRRRGLNGTLLSLVSPRP